MTDIDIAPEAGLSNWMVGYWRKRFLVQGVEGLRDEMKSGRPRTIEDEQIAALPRKTIREKPENAVHWTCRAAAEETGLSKSTVHRVWRAFSLAPHRQKVFTLSTGPFFVEKVRDIVELYLNPPDKAMALCVDEKNQFQAIERTQAMRPLGLGYVEGMTHDCVRRGTTTLFAALDVATGEVLTRCKTRRRHAQFLSFLRHIDANVPKDIDLHLVVDNYAATNTRKSAAGSPSGRAATRTTLRRIRRGSTRRESRSTSSRKRRFDAARSKA